MIKLRPRIQDMRNGTFQPIVTVASGPQSSAVFGTPLATVQEAWDAACDACEAALPAGGWSADGWHVGAEQ
jgi:hypothetical protein